MKPQSGFRPDLNTEERDELFMRIAVREAQRAALNGDVPIGCVLVFDGKCSGSRADKHAEALGILPGTIIGRGYNRRNKDHSSLMHAEILAIRQACRAISDWRVEDCTLYVTLEPCPMCAGAIVEARIPRLVMGTPSPKSGCAGSVLDLMHVSSFNHQVEVRSFDPDGMCRKMLSDFFAALRSRQMMESQRMVKKI